MVKKRFLLGMLVLALVFGMMVVGCDDGSTKETPVSEKTLSAKWTISGSTDTTFEFTPDNIYIVVGAFGEPASRAAADPQAQVYVYTGTYTISGDQIILEGFGVLEITSFSDEEFSFSLKLTDSDTIFDFQAVKQDDIIEASTQTDLLCRAWKVTKVSAGYESKAVGILFSKAGTYLVTYKDGSSALAEWKWGNDEQTIFQYSWNHWERYGNVQILELTASSFKYNDYGSMDYELERIWEFEPWR